MSEGFTRYQLKKLATALDATRIQSREQDGKTLSYVEGWFVISEANRIFGYDGWDRQMVHFERLFERRSSEGTVCGYVARVAIQVRAQGTTIVREGTGFGQASAKRLADSHELALKAAETDATKRALSTFGGRFGLMLYDKEQRPVRSGAPEQKCESARNETNQGSDAARIEPTASGACPPTATDTAAPGGDAQSANALSLANLAPENSPPNTYRLVASDGTPTDMRAPESFCSALRQFIEAAGNKKEVLRLRQNNQTTIAGLRALPELTNLRGEHYVEILERLFGQRMAELATLRFADDAQIVVDAPSETALSSSTKIDDAAASNEIETAVAQALPAEASQLPKIYEPFVQVPPYPQKGLAARIASATKRRTGEAGHEWDIPDRPLVTSRAMSAADSPADHPAVVLRTRRSLITRGFSIDKSALLVPSERRLRSKAHLQFVAAKPCVICENLPCHAHHVTFAQTRGLSQKVSDEFTVPLCVVHHNELHAFGNEASWWRAQGIEPLQVASALWRETVI